MQMVIEEQAGTCSLQSRMILSRAGVGGGQAQSSGGAQVSLRARNETTTQRMVQLSQLTSRALVTAGAGLPQRPDLPKGSRHPAGLLVMPHQ